MALTVRLIPCLDVDCGRVVKGTNFVNLRDAGDPVEIAKRYNQQGADELAFLDITASSENRQAIGRVIQQVANTLFIPMTVGGGVKTLQDIERLLHCGADKVSINSGAIANPELVKQAAYRFGCQCIVVAIDAKMVAPNKWHIFTHGGRQATAIDALQWAQKMSDDGAGEILLTSMDRDGTKAGFDLALTRAISDTIKVPLIASGGVGHPQHLLEGLIEGKADAVLAASIFHYTEYTIQQAKKFLHQRGVKVRL